MAKKHVRIDVLLVERGLAPTREKAKALLMAGGVIVRNQPVTKAGTLVDGESVVYGKFVQCLLSKIEVGISLDC